MAVLQLSSHQALAATRVSGFLHISEPAAHRGCIKPQTYIVADGPADRAPVPWAPRWHPAALKGWT